MSPNANEKDIEKFIRFLALKTAQIVVQSRLGDKIQLLCNPHAPGYDWFNIVIEDHPDVSCETKKAIQGDVIFNRLPLCIEISLKTVDGDQMNLEFWSLELNTECGNKSDPHLNAAQAIYSRMGILLKSLISLTRATPAYKLSRRQSPDAYSIYYNIYVGTPQVHTLGEGYKHFRVGQLSTIVGCLSMSVAYRTKMTISPTNAGGHDGAIMLKSDHFLKDLSPKNARYYNTKKITEKKVVDLDKPLRLGAFVDTSKIKQFSEDDYILPENPPFSWLIRKPSESGSPLGSEIGSFPKISHSPTAIFTSQNNNNNSLGTSPVKSLIIPIGEEMTKTTIAIKQTTSEDENLLKELRFPFASATSQHVDLANFIRDCSHAPPLHICEQESISTSSEDGVDELAKQLDDFETSLDDYEYLVSTLACSSSKASSTSN